MNLWMHLLEIEITSRCNLNCKHCYNRENKNIDMPLDEILYYINFANDNNVSKLVISGGEACLHRDFDKLAEYMLINRKKLKNIKKIVLQSNGMIGKFDLDKLKGFDMIHLSFDVDNNEAREISSKKTLDLAKRIKDHGINCYLFATVHSKNINYVDDIIKMANDSGNQIAFNLCCDTGHNAEFLLTKKQKIETINKLLKYEKEGKINTLKHPYANSLKGLCVPDEEYKVKGGCTAGIATCTILANGDVIPCPFLRIVAGNIHDNKLEDIWMNSELFKSLRDRHNYDMCGKCKFVAYCGGCRKSAIQTSLSPTGMDLNCIVHGALNIRKATKNDIDNIVKIKTNNCKEIYEDILNEKYIDKTSYEESYKFLSNKKDDNSYLYVLTKDNKIVGYSKFSIVKDEDYDSLIDEFYVEPKFKNKGYGTVLFNYTKEFLKQRDCHKLSTWCAYKDKVTKQFFKNKNGKESKKYAEVIDDKRVYKVMFTFDI